MWRTAATPLGRVWRTAARHRLRRLATRSRRLPAPVVSVGNVTVGGGGKTSLVRWLIEEGVPDRSTVGILARGVGREGKDDVVVLEPGTGTRAASGAGDEPALLSRTGAWVAVGADRIAAGRTLARRAEIDLFLLDDGLQHRQVARALDLVAFSDGDLRAPARCLPAGPLRQGPEWIPPMGAWVVSGGDPRDETWPSNSIGEAFAPWWDGLPGTSARWEDEGTVGLPAWIEGRDDPFPAPGPVVVFAGVARPASVAAFARRAGFDVTAEIAFPDHHAYRREDVSRLLDDHPESPLLTTEKDAVKLDPGWFGSRAVGVLRRRLVPRDGDLLRTLVREAMGGEAP